MMIGGSRHSPDIDSLWQRQVEQRGQDRLASGTAEVRDAGSILDAFFFLSLQFYLFSLSCKFVFKGASVSASVFISTAGLLCITLYSVAKLRDSIISHIHFYLFHSSYFFFFSLSGIFVFERASLSASVFITACLLCITAFRC